MKASSLVVVLYNCCLSCWVTQPIAEWFRRGLGILLRALGLLQVQKVTVTEPSASCLRRQVGSRVPSSGLRIHVCAASDDGLLGASHGVGCA